MLSMDASLAAMHREAQQRRARRLVDDIDDLRSVQNATKRNLTQREIAELLETSQPKVHRLLKAIERKGGDLKKGPEEIALRAFAYDTDRSILVKELSELQYTFGEAAPYPHEGRTSGSWDQLLNALAKDLITKDEFEQIRAFVGR